MQTPRDALLAASRHLNDQIRALDEALASGERSPARIETIRREAAASLERLRTVQGGAGIVGETIPKVSEHLDLFVDIAGSAGTDPALSRKLLKHLLDEQLELTAAAERDAAPVSAAPAGREAGAGSPARAEGPLPGGRRPLTVGSLIGR